MAEFLNFLSRMILSLNNSRIHYVIVGGLAAIIRGRTRTTQDVDLIIENNLLKVEALFQELKQHGFDLSDQQAQYSIHEGFNLSIFDVHSALRLDIKIAKDSEDLAALEQIIQEHYQGLTLNVVTIEQFLFGKILYLGDLSDIREDEELLEFNDVLDFLTIYRLYEKKIDNDRLKRQVKAYKLEKTFARLLHLKEDLR